MSGAVAGHGDRRRAVAPIVERAACRYSVLVKGGSSAAAAFACRDIGLAPSCRQVELVGAGGGVLLVGCCVAGGWA